MTTTVDHLAAIGELRRGGGARTGPLALDVVEGLAFAWRGGRRWPAVVVHAGTGLVVDGAHRLEAARRLDLTCVPVTEVTGTDDDAFLEGVRANHLDGRPLSPGDRRRAVERIVVAFPDLAYREVMAATGASAGVVNRARAVAGLCVPAPRRSPQAPEDILGRLRGDPSMRQTREGAEVLGALRQLVDAVRRGQRQGAPIPLHRAELVADLLRWCAESVVTRAP